MKTKSFVTRAVGAVAVLAFAGAAVAQTPAKPPAAAPAPAALPPVQHGAPINGVCVYDVAQVLTASTVGKFVDGRLDQIGKAINSELQTEEAQIQTEAKAIDAAGRAAGPGAADDTTLQKRAVDVQSRAKKWEAKANLRQREFNATQQKARIRILREVDPIVVTVYQQKGCSLLFSKESVMLVNPAMDITPAVIAGLNGKIQQFTFDRERLDQPAAPAVPVKP